MMGVKAMELLARKPEVILGFGQKVTLISKLEDIGLSKGEEVPEEYGNVNNSFFKKNGLQAFLIQCDYMYKRFKLSGGTFQMFFAGFYVFFMLTCFVIFE